MVISSLRKTQHSFYKFNRPDVVEKPNGSTDKKLFFTITDRLNYHYGKNLIMQEAGGEVFSLISNYVDIESSSSLIISKKEESASVSDEISSFENIINLNLVNNERWLNKYFEVVNSQMHLGGIYIGCVETKNERKARILQRSWKPFNWIHYTFDFLHKRVMPKLSFTKGFYFNLSKGRNRVITKAETLGRLVSCGFKIMDEQDIDKKLWFVVKKISEPLFDNSPSYGMFYKMPRVGKDGKIIYVYKLRTMHPFSEYLQEYLINKNGYDEDGKGKIKDDYRVSSYSLFLRRLWIDELPQLLNVFKGEMNLVGVRPLSRARFNEFPEDIKQKRLKYKPGCIPPYVALLLGDENGNIEAERIYLNYKEKHPVWADIKFFMLAVYNILTNKIRSA